MKNTFTSFTEMDFWNYIFKLKIAISYVSNVSKYTEWKQQDSENMLYCVIYFKRFIHINDYIPHHPPPHKNHLEK